MNGDLDRWKEALEATSTMLAEARTEVVMEGTYVRNEEVKEYLTQHHPTDANLVFKTLKRKEISKNHVYEVAEVADDGKTIRSANRWEPKAPGEESMKNMVHDFYQRLWERRDMDKKAQQEVLRHIEHRADIGQRATMERAITEEEVEQVVATMLKNKTPGQDGLTTEFYQTFPELNKYLLHIDWQKAYDRIDHEFLKAALARIGVGGRTMNAVEALYNGARAVVEVNGHMTDEIEIRSGVRQGCPLSPMLFIIAMEGMIRMTQANKDIKAIAASQLGGPSRNQAPKVMAYADDVTFGVQDEWDVKKCLEIAEIFARASGGKVNVEKSRVILVGRTDCASFKAMAELHLRPLSIVRASEESVYLGDPFPHPSKIGTWRQRRSAKPWRRWRRK